MSIYTIAIYLIVALAGLSSCSASVEKESEREKKEERRVNILTVVDVNSGDTIQIASEQHLGTWAQKKEKCSPNYTTNINAVLVVD